tara:strand:+ start:23819 stop:25525 length:1707 start_codon:yes stop_codon:yes gene_type:complete
MPDYDIEQWLIDNGIDAPEELSNQASDYWGGQYDQVDQLMTWDTLFAGDTADVVMAHMYNYTQENEGFTDEDFAEELFQTLWATAPYDSQAAFVTEWNQSGNDIIISDNFDVDEVAAYWAQSYGSDISGTSMFDQSVLSGAFDDLTATISGGEDGEGGLIQSYINTYGYDQWMALVESEQSQEDIQNQTSQSYTDALLNQSEQFQTNADNLQETYQDTAEAVRTREQATGLTSAGRSSFGGGIDLEILNAQIDALESGQEGATELEGMQQELLSQQWDDYMEGTFSDWQDEAGVNFDVLLTELNNAMSTYNEQVASGFSDQAEADILAMLGGLANAGAITPPTGETGWSNLGNLGNWWANEEGGCITGDGNFGVVCPDGSCSEYLSGCATDTDSNNDDDGTGDGTGGNTGGGTGGGGGDDYNPDNNSQEEINCMDSENQYHPDCIFPHPEFDFNHWFECYNDPNCEPDEQGSGLNDEETLAWYEDHSACYLAGQLACPPGTDAAQQGSSCYNQGEDPELVCNMTTEQQHSDDDFLDDTPDDDLDTGNDFDPNEDIYDDENWDLDQGWS